MPRCPSPSHPALAHQDDAHVVAPSPSARAHGLYRAARKLVTSLHEHLTSSKTSVITFSHSDSCPDSFPVITKHKRASFIASTGSLRLTLDFTVGLYFSRPARSCRQAEPMCALLSSSCSGIASIVSQVAASQHGLRLLSHVWNSMFQQQQCRSMAQVKFAAQQSEPVGVPEEAGRIHSVDSFSAVDGPGVRMVVFEQVGYANKHWQCCTVCTMVECSRSKPDRGLSSTGFQPIAIVTVALCRVVGLCYALQVL